MNICLNNASDVERDTDKTSTQRTVLDKKGSIPTLQAESQDPLCPLQDLQIRKNLLAQEKFNTAAATIYHTLGTQKKSDGKEAAQ